MAISLAALLAIGAIAPTIINAATSGIKKFKRFRDPEGYQRQEILKQFNITPEQYDLRRQNLQEGLGAFISPQQIFNPAQANIPATENIGLELPQTIGTPAQAQRPGGLAEILNLIAQNARTGYQNDLAAIGARRGPVRNRVGRTSGQLGLMSEALRGRIQGFAQDRFKLLSDYANRNAIADIEAGNLNLQRESSQDQLSNFIEQFMQQQQAGQQQQFLGQQQLNRDEANLRNILGGEQYQQRIRQYQIGQQAPYTFQQAPEGV